MAILNDSLALVRHAVLTETHSEGYTSARFQSLRDDTPYKTSVLN